MDTFFVLLGLLGLTVSAYMLGFMRGVEKSEEYVMQSIREMELRMLRKLEMKISLDGRPVPSDTKVADEPSKKRLR